MPVRSRGWPLPAMVFWFALIMEPRAPACLCRGSGGSSRSWRKRWQIRAANPDVMLPETPARCRRDRLFLPTDQSIMCAESHRWRGSSRAGGAGGLFCIALARKEKSQHNRALTTQTSAAARVILRACPQTSASFTCQSEAYRGQCPCGSVVEHSLGKGEVARSIRAMGTTFHALAFLSAHPVRERPWRFMGQSATSIQTSGVFSYGKGQV